MIDKGESVTTKMVAALQGAKSRQTQELHLSKFWNW